MRCYIVVAALAAAGLSYLLAIQWGATAAIAATVSITLFTALLWVTEAIPIPVASLIPFFAFPMANVLSHKEAAASLGNHVILLLMGAFMLSKAIEKSQVHRRFALYILQLTGAGSARRIVLAFMVTAAVLSMWISNTATTLMLLPIALAVSQSLQNTAVTIAILLGVAYAASVGGVGTPIGTPPNIILMSVYQEHTGNEINFIDWMMVGVPVVLLAIPVMGWWLSRGLGTVKAFDLPAAGQWKSAEIRVLMVFGMVVLAWVTRPMWSEWFDLNWVGDSSIALAGVVAMFLVPAGRDGDAPQAVGETGERLLDWQTANTIPWGMLLLFAGGICIAKGFSASGLSQQIGGFLSDISVLPLFMLIVSLCLLVTFLTEITSNTATATLLMPILAVTGTALGMDPVLLMMPAAMSASCAFMLPVATAPNAIVYSANVFTIKQMAIRGAVLNIALAGIVASVVWVAFATG